MKRPRSTHIKGRDQKKDYPYIRRWGDMMGSSPLYIAGELAKARTESAPQTAIYVRTDFDTSTSRFVKGEWQTIENVTNRHTRQYFIVRGWMTPEWEVPTGTIPEPKGGRRPLKEYLNPKGTNCHE